MEGDLTVLPMSPKRRFLSGVLGGRVDRPPVGSPVSVVTTELMEATGSFFPQAHLDPREMAYLAAGGYEILGYDCIMPVFSVVQEAAALGCDVDWGRADTMPTVRTHPWSDARDVRIPSDFLENPAISTVLQALILLRQQYGDRAALVGKAMGPWSLALHVCGLEEFLVQTLWNPENVRQMLARLLEVTLLFGRAQIAAGADVLCIPDHVTGNLVGPQTYRDLVLPLHRRLTQELGCPLILHCCGNTFDRLHYFAIAGFDCYHFESAVDAQMAAELVGERMSLVGNVNNPQTLLRGSPDDVRREAFYAWTAGVQILGPECAVPLGTPNANLKAIVDLAREVAPA